MNTISLNISRRKYVIAMLSIASFLSITLVAGRIYFTHSLHYAFLIWNLFLAWIPLYFSNKISISQESKTSKAAVVGLFFIWLLFFPNSPYILTDFFHLGPTRQNVPRWYDLVLIASFAWNGLMAGYISLLDIHKFLNKTFRTSVSWAIVLFSLILSGFWPSRSRNLPVVLSSL